MYWDPDKGEHCFNPGIKVIIFNEDNTSADVFMVENPGTSVEDIKKLLLTEVKPTVNNIQAVAAVLTEAKPAVSTLQAVTAVLTEAKPTVNTISSPTSLPPSYINQEIGRGVSMPRSSSMHQVNRRSLSSSLMPPSYIMQETVSGSNVDHQRTNHKPAPLVPNIKQEREFGISLNNVSPAHDISPPNGQDISLYRFIVLPDYRSCYGA